MSRPRSSMDRKGFELVPKERWMSKSSADRCTKCGKIFGIFRSADNCHSCGRVLCTNSCLDNSMVLPGHPGTAPVPVCDECATCIRRIQQDSEMAVHRCHILEELLNEQTIQSERLMNQSKDLRAENEALLREKESLHGEVRRLQLQLEVAAAQSALNNCRPSEADGGVTAAGAGASASSLSSTTAAVGAATTSEGVAAAEKALEKKKKMLDIREATLQEALKKVSNDAAKLVSQRNALQEQEKTLKAALTQQFVEVFEKQRRILEEDLLAERDTVNATFQDWLREASQSGNSMAAAPPDQEAHASGSEATATTKHRATAGTHVSQEEVDALKRVHEEALDKLDKEHVAAKSSLEEKLRLMEAALRAKEEELLSLAGAQRRAQMWAEDKLIMQGSIDALRRTLDEAQERERKLQAEGEQLKHSNAEAQKRVEQLMAAHLQELQRREQQEKQTQQQLQEQQQQQAIAKEEEWKAEEASLKAALTDAEHKLAIVEAQAAVLLSDQKQCAEQHEALVSRLHHDVAEARKERSHLVAEERQRWASQCSAMTQELKEKHEVALHELKAKHDESVEELRRMHNGKEEELREQLKAEKQRQSTAVTVAKKSTHMEDVEKLQAYHDKVVEDLQATVRELEVAHTKAEASAAQKQKAALAAQGEELEAKEQARLAEQRRTHTAEVEAIREMYAAEIRSLEATRDGLREQCLALQTDMTSLTKQLQAAQASMEEAEAVAEREPAAAASVVPPPPQPEDVKVVQGIGVTPVAEVMLSSVRLIYSNALEQHATALSAGRLHLQSASKTVSAVSEKHSAAAKQFLEQTEEQHAEVVAKLQRQLKAAKREGQSHEQRARERTQEALEHTRTMSAQAEEIKLLKERLEKAKKAVVRAERSATAAAAAAAAATTSTSVSLPPIATQSKSDVTTDPKTFYTAALTWERGTTVIANLYADALATVLVRDLLAASVAVTKRVAASLEKYRANSRRQAVALEQTTNTIRTVQTDLRTRAQELAQREELVERREKRAAKLGEALMKKRRAIVEVCGSLHSVVVKLREREQGVVDDEGSLESMQATAAALADDTNSVELNGASP